MTCFHVNVRCKFILFITDYVIVESGLLWNMELSNPSACSNDSTNSYLSVSKTHPLVIAELVRYYALSSRSPPFPPPPHHQSRTISCLAEWRVREGCSHTKAVVSGVVAQAGSVLGQIVRVPVFSQERTAVVLGCLHASITINPNQVQMNR